MFGSVEQGIGWGDSGPEPGYFPFLHRPAAERRKRGQRRVDAGALASLERRFVSRVRSNKCCRCSCRLRCSSGAMPFTGIYLASAVFIAWFMWRDKVRAKPYGKLMIGSVSVGAVLASYLIFALWFKVPLDAGPMGDWIALAGRSLQMSEFDSLLQGMNLILTPGPYRPDGGRRAAGHSGRCVARPRRPQRRGTACCR
jgi:hypothetical protein